MNAATCNADSIISCSIRGGNFYELSFSSCLRRKFSQIVTDCLEYQLKKVNILRVKVSPIKVNSNSPLEYNPLAIHAVILYVAMYMFVM